MDNKQRILKISKELDLAHIGSCLSVLPILEYIYSIKAPEDKVLLGNAHAHLAHLVVKYGIMLRDDELEVMDKEWVEKSIKLYGIHCDIKQGCDASGGSLGHALGIAIGMSLASPKIKIHVITSDGEMMEGSCWEALRLIHDLQLYQIHIYCNFNGYTAVSKYSSKLIERRMNAFNIPNIKYYHTNNGRGFSGVKGHYKKL